MFLLVNFYNNIEYFKLLGIKWVFDCLLLDLFMFILIFLLLDLFCVLLMIIVGSIDVEWIIGLFFEMILLFRICCICILEMKIVLLDCFFLVVFDCVKVLFCRNEKE